MVGVFDMAWGYTLPPEEAKRRAEAAEAAKQKFERERQEKERENMNDDLDKLVRQDLPKLAYSIASSGPRRMKSKAHFSNRPNRVADDQTNWKEHDKTRTLDYCEATTINSSPAYLYSGTRKGGGSSQKEWYVAFYGVRLVDVEKVEPGPIDINPGEIKLESVRKVTNNGPAIKKMRKARTQRTEKTKEFSFDQLLETEFTIAMTRSAKGGIPGVGEAGMELSTSLRALAQLQAHQAWSQSDSVEDLMEEEYSLFPYSTLELLAKKGTPTITQKTRTTGTLQCNVRIDIRDCNMQDFDNIDSVMKTWRGLEAGHEFYTPYFTQNPVPMDWLSNWHLPKLVLDLEVKGKRVRYDEIVENYTPLPGFEREFEIGRRAHYRAIGD